MTILPDAGCGRQAPLEPATAHSSLLMVTKISSCDAHSDESRKHPTHLHLRILHWIRPLPPHQKNKNKIENG